MVAAAVVMGSNPTWNGIPSGFGTAPLLLEGKILPVEVPLPVWNKARCSLQIQDLHECTIEINQTKMHFTVPS